MVQIHQGTERTREFYDSVGWKEQDGVLEDRRLFGVREDGPIRKRMHARSVDHLLNRFRSLGDGLRILEMGCGGTPETRLFPLASHYTGVDFSSTGLEAAAKVAGEVPHDFVQADITQLPFEDGTFDAVYCAHVLYHIDTPEGHRAALREGCRVVRPGGIVAFIIANPFPLLFPIRLGRRIVASVLKRGGSGALPYLPMTPAWYAREVSSFGTTEVRCSGMASTWFNHHVSEFKPFGRLAWTTLDSIHRRFPMGSVRFGNYATIFLRRSETTPS